MNHPLNEEFLLQVWCMAPCNRGFEQDLGLYGIGACIGLSGGRHYQSSGQEHGRHIFARGIGQVTRVTWLIARSQGSISLERKRPEPSD
jgi:hypothetical protein